MKKISWKNKKSKGLDFSLISLVNYTKFMVLFSQSYLIATSFISRIYVRMIKRHFYQQVMIE